MIRNLLATTAVATLVASGAMAQTTAPTPSDPATQQQPTDVPMEVKAEGHLASELIGESVYNGTGDDAESIGEVNDVVISPEGEVQSVVIGVGGFLGLGSKDVAIEYDLVSWAEMDGNRYIVVETTADALKALPDFDRTAFRPLPADAQVGQTEPATAEDLSMAEQDAAAGKTAAEGEANQATDGTVVEDQSTAGMESGQGGDKTAMSPLTEPEAQATDDTMTSSIDRSQMQPASVDKIRAEEFVGTTVYGANDENVGEIGDVVMTPEGEVDAVIVDVGGFLGMGEKPVALGMDNIRFMTDSGGDYYLFTRLTKEELEAHPAYDEATYTQKRDEMRLIVPN